MIGKKPVSAVNKAMGQYKATAMKQGVKFNKAGEMTSNPTKSQVADFNKKFTTTKAPIKTMKKK